MASVKNRNSTKIVFARKLGVFVVLGLLVVAGVAGQTNVAKADPHGIYYTAIGQQQLFFNVLAALDQADYVETAGAREGKREAREQVKAEQPFVRESESGARFTTGTELEKGAADNYGATTGGEPTLVNRQVTLEGADLYTDQLVRQYGAEFARRNAATELLQTLCAYGFGYAQCNYDSTGISLLESHIVETRHKNATVVDPLEWASLPFWNGVWAALNSGNLERTIDNPHPNNLTPSGGTSATLNDEEYRAGKVLSPDVYGAEPLAYSAEIAQWRKKILEIEGTNNPISMHTVALNNLLTTLKRLYQPSDPIPYPFQEFVFDSGGNVSLAGLSYQSSVCGNTIPCLNPYAPSWSIASKAGMTVSKYFIEVGDMARAGNKRISDIAANAAQRITLQQEMIQNEGVLAKTTLQSNSISGLTSYGELNANIDTPVAAKVASIYGIPNVLGQLATSQQASSLEGLDIPGGVQLVKRGVGSFDYLTPPSPAPASGTGALAPNNENGQVAGALDLLFKPKRNDFDKKRKDTTSPSANIISPILEVGARHALRVMTAGRWRPAENAGLTCGFTCDDKPRRQAPI